MLIELSNIKKEIPDAISAIKSGIKILHEFKADSAAAIISIKMVDAIDCMVKMEMTKAVEDLWRCAATIQILLYESLSEYYGKGSPHAKVGKVKLDEGEYREAYEYYLSANKHVSEGTDCEPLFGVEQ